VDVGTFARGIVAHMRGILICSLLLGLLAMAPSLLLPPTYLSLATVRVVPPTGQDYVDADSLATAVEWYVALADVNAVVEQASELVQPPMDANEVVRQTALVIGEGPGEVAVRGTSRDPATAVSLSNAMAQSVVTAVTEDEALQIGDTTVSLLRSAQPANRVGTHPVTMFLTGFLLGFVLLATGAALLHRHLNWRLTPRMLKALGDEAGVPVLTADDDLSAYLALKGKQGSQAWLATAPGVPQSWWSDLEDRVRLLGGASEVESLRPGGTVPADPAPGRVYVPDPNDGSASALGVIAATEAPALVVCPSGQRAKALRKLLTQLGEFGVRPLALTVAAEKDEMAETSA